MLRSKSVFSIYYFLLLLMIFLGVFRFEKESVEKKEEHSSDHTIPPYTIPSHGSTQKAPRRRYCKQIFCSSGFLTLYLLASQEERCKYITVFG